MMMADPRPYRPRDQRQLVVHRLEADASRRFPENALGIREWGLWYTLAGAARWGEGRKRWLLGPGEAALVRPDVPHLIEVPAGGRWRFYSLHFPGRAHWQPWLRWPEADPDKPGVMRLSLDDPLIRRKVQRHLAKAHRHVHGGSPDRESFGLAEVELALLWLNQLNPLHHAGTIDIRVRRAMDYLAANIEKPLQRADAARAASLSEPRLAELFREQVGLTPMQYLEQRRMARAMQLLEGTAMPVAEVAAMVGYADPDYFGARFRRRTGRTPLAYRRHASAAPRN